MSCYQSFVHRLTPETANELVPQGVIEMCAIVAVERELTKFRYEASPGVCLLR